VLVGEIRDQETARIAMQAAQTGHLVLSTLHTDDAPSCITRLTDIGIEPYVSASALIGVVAQRLMRRLCTQCRRPYTPDPETLRAMSVTEEEAATLTFYHAVGCEHCHHTGYRGRPGIYEVMPVNDRLRRLIAQRGSEAQLREAALSGGMLSLGEDGLQKVKAGVTTPDELLRAVTEVRAARATCAGCGASVSADFLACPSCGHCVGGGCPHCERPLQAGWKFCPYCSRSTEAPRHSSRRLREKREGRELPAGNVTGFKKLGDNSPVARTHYELLDVAHAAPAEEIKHAFRREIAKYHPDKVQHPGQEFQDIASARAAELTQAYKTRTNAALRAECDASLGHVPLPAPEASEPASPEPTHPPADAAPGAAA